MGMKHIKLFEQFVTEGYTGKWKVETWGKMPGAPEWEIVDVKKGFKDDDEANKWADSQKQGKDLSYAIEPEEGWFDPAGTWHPDQDPDSDDFYDPTSAYESKNEDDLKDVPPTAIYDGKNGEKIEVKEIEGQGMAGEPMTFAYVFCDGKISHSKELKSVMTPSDFKDMSDYLRAIADSNEASAISWAE